MPSADPYKYQLSNTLVTRTQSRMSFTFTSFNEGSIFFVKNCSLSYQGGL